MTSEFSPEYYRLYNKGVDRRNKIRTIRRKEFKVKFNKIKKKAKNFAIKYPKAILG